MNDVAKRHFAIGTALAENLATRLQGRDFSMNRDYRRAMLFLFCKAFKTFQAIELLWTNGYEEDAATLLRSIYELRVQARLMAGKPVDQSKQFMDHWFRSQFGNLQILRRLFPGRKSALDEAERQLREKAGEDRVELFCDPQLAERATKRNWYGKTFKDALSDLGLEHEYETTYSQLSDYTHSGVSLFHRYVALSGNYLGMVFRPAHSESTLVPWSAALWLSQIVGVTGAAFDLDFNETVMQAQTALIEGNS
jgi:Family of unknown function (DUF5677)